MSSAQVRVTAIAIARQALSLRRVLRQPVHAYSDLNPKMRSKNFVVEFAVAACATGRRATSSYARLSVIEFADSAL
jgi:hypothetical protein